MMNNRILAIAAVAIGFTATGAQAADVLNPGTGVPHALTALEYTQNFNTLKSTSSDPTPANALPSGWQAYESGNGANGTYQFGSASSNTAGIWSYGSSSDRALGGKASPDVSLMYFGAVFENALGGTIDSLAINYTGEQWQNGFNRAALRFEYSLDATSIANGTWTSVSSLDFLAPSTAAHGGSKFGIASTNGNSAAFQTQVGGVIDGLSIGAGSAFGIRWTLADIDTAGVTSDDGLAIDNFSLAATTVTAVPEPATWAMMIGGMGLVGSSLRRRRTTASFA